MINGTDLECGVEYAHLEEAVKRGLITEERINTSLRRLLEARFALGEMDPDSIVAWSKIGIDTVDCDLHRQMALDITRKSMVLLHNNGILPLAKTSTRIAVMGPNAVDSVMQWGIIKEYLRIHIPFWREYAIKLVTFLTKKDVNYWRIRF